MLVAEVGWPEAFMTVGGSFTVNELSFDYSDPDNPVLESVSISFEMQAYNHSGAMVGTVNYNYAPAGPATRPHGQDAHATPLSPVESMNLA